MVLAAITENNLPLSMAPVLVDLAKELSTDKKALDTLSMDRTTASYKLTHGLGKTLLERTLESIRQCKFSLNIDESTSNNHKRVLAILVSYFSKAEDKVVVEHLDSIEVVKVDAKSLYSALVKLFDDYSLPWGNLVSILMDSCAVMRGSKNGLEKLIKDNKAPHLLDIDGDICHHVHNACKKFCAPFEHWVEGLFADLHNDMKWSADMKESFSEVCELLNLKFTMPERFVSHRWLSVYDLSTSTLRLMDAFQVFYFSFFSADDKAIYQGLILEIYRKRSVGTEARRRLKEIQETMSKKTLTDDGKARKRRIIEKTLVKSKKSSLIMHFYQSALPMMKSYVCLFQSKKPLIHLIYDKLEELFKNFLSCFLKPESIPKKGSSLKRMNLDDEECLLKERDIFFGTGAHAIMKTSKKADSTIIYFVRHVSMAYKECAKYLQKKLPLDNKLLHCISAVDPSAIGHSISTRCLAELEAMVACLDDQEKERYILQIRQIQVDTSLPVYDEKMTVDEWWAKISKGEKYGDLCKLVLSVLSIFHGPQVESSFNTMGDVIDIRSTRMNIETYSKYQTVKYFLKARNTTAVEMFKRKDILHEAVDRKLCINMKKSASEYKRVLEEKKAEKEKRIKMMNLKRNLMSKAEKKRQIAITEKKMMKKHHARQKLKTTKSPGVSNISSQPSTSVKEVHPTISAANIPDTTSDKAQQSTSAAEAQPTTSSEKSHISDQSENTSNIPFTQRKRKARLTVLKMLVKKRKKTE